MQYLCWFLFGKSQDLCFLYPLSISTSHWMQRFDLMFLRILYVNTVFTSFISFVSSATPPMLHHSLSNLWLLFNFMLTHIHTYICMYAKNLQSHLACYSMSIYGWSLDIEKPIRMLSISHALLVSIFNIYHLTPLFLVWLFSLFISILSETRWCSHQFG